jgi:hypothetical protein
MRYFCYSVVIEPDMKPTVTECLSEEDIRKQYYDVWKERMVIKYGEEDFLKHWSFEECLEDWCILNDATQVG